MVVDINSLKTVLRKACAVNSKPTEESFPELPTVLVWQRFLLAIGYGLFMGINGVKGGAVILHTLNLIAFVPVMYCRLFLGTEAGMFGSQIMFAGLVPALALAILIWIYCFTAMNEEGERKLASMLISTAASQFPMDGISSGDEAAVNAATPVVEDSEF